MKKIYIGIISLFLISCNDFLDTRSYTQKNETNFPANENDMQSALDAVYARLNYDNKVNVPMFADIMSDDMFGGGAENDTHVLALENFMVNDMNTWEPIWKKSYEAILRANFLIQNIDQITWSDLENRNRILGEAHFLRSFHYFDLARIFGNIPMPLDYRKPENLPQVSPHVLYGQIAYDMKEAINLIPAVTFPEIKEKDLGSATKWAAEAMMGRIFLFYTGRFNVSEIKLSDGSIITKSDVIKWIDDCALNSGHSLVSDFRNLWPYAAILPGCYKYRDDNNLSWCGNGKEATEDVFSIVCGIFGNKLEVFHNTRMRLTGWRSQDRVPIGQGSGFCTVNPQLYYGWFDDPNYENDIRRNASILNAKSEEEANKDGCEGELFFDRTLGNPYHVTYFFDKKNSPAAEFKTEPPYTADSKSVNICVRLFGTTTAFRQCQAVNVKIIRLADVYLMGAELGSSHAQEYLDKVRSRAGLASIPVTLENIKKERRYELAFEGVRYWDLLRWHDEAELDKVVRVPVYNGAMGLRYLTCKYRPETEGLLPIPLQEIKKSNGVLKQNPGWSDTPNYDPSINYQE